MAHCYRCGDVEIRPAERQLLVAGRPVGVGARAFDVLIALVDRRERIVSKDELLDIVWPHAIVEENNLQAQISALRKVLGARAFATIPGRGYQLTLAVEEAEAPSAPRGATNLPPAASALIGRHADLAAIARLLAEHRVVTLVGPGGVGKTRLAQQAASVALPAHRHGVWWVDLASVSSPHDVAPATARALRVPLGNGDSRAGLAASLRDRDLLLVFDNCEHLAAAVASVTVALLDGAPRVHVLATSQRVIGMAGEQVYHVEGLDVPPASASLEAARAHDAMRLLEACIAARDRHLVVDERTLPMAIDLCARLDGNPLAIEMAAARLPVLGFDGLQERLGERLRLLQSANGGRSAHRSLQATLEWSYSLLDRAEQAALRRLSTFAGPFTLRQAEVACADLAAGEADAIDRIAALVGKSMLRVEHAQPTRYRLLETTRLFAAEALAAHGEVEEARRRHGEAMREVAIEANASYWTQADWLERFIREYADLQAAFEHACARRDAALAAPIAQALSFLDLERNDHSPVRGRKRAVHPLLATAGGRDRALLLNAMSIFRMVYDPTYSRIDIARERVAAWRALGDERQLYWALARLAADCVVIRDDAGAELALAEARALEDAGWPPKFRGVYRNHARIVAMYRGDARLYLAQAREFLEAALRDGDARGAAFRRLLVAEALLMGGDVAAAIEAASQALTEFTVLDQPYNQDMTGMLLAAALVQANDLEAARACAVRAIDRAWHYGMGCWFCDHLALLAARTGRLREAAAMLGIADAGYTANQDRRQPNEARAARQCQALLEDALGTDALAQLRAEGGQLPDSAALALVKSTLAS